ncbi:MAG: rhodanese-like domain-containing protein [Bacteroidetes bacterium]|nr:rhodanese-like domain-containing protein [Bacteroidota bacterium]
MTTNTKFAFSVLGVIVFLLMAMQFATPENQEPWTSKQLMQPAELAKKISNGDTQDIYIFDMGPAAEIKHSIHIGEGQDTNNIINLQKMLNPLNKNANIVIYCGCCPFKDCPNIRPAFQLLNQMKFVNHKLLNLENNIKVDWIDKGYPLKD